MKPKPYNPAKRCVPPWWRWMNPYAMRARLNRRRARKGARKMDGTPQFLRCRTPYGLGVRGLVWDKVMPKRMP